MTIANGNKCEAVQGRLRSFFEDLLTEEEYQDVCSHIGACDACRQYASSTGSISFLLHELGNVTVPKDLGETISFRVDHPPGSRGMAGEHKKDETRPFSRRVLWGAIAVIIIAAAVVWSWRWLGMKTKDASVTPDALLTDQPPEEMAGYSVKIARPAAKPATGEEAEQLFHQLQMMADTLEKSAGTDQEALSRLQKDDGGEEPAGAVIPAESGQPPVAAADAGEPAADSLHWHMPLTEKKRLGHLLETLAVMNIDLQYKDGDFLIFKATAGQLNTIFGGMEFSGTAGQEMPQFTAAQVKSGKTVSVVIRLMDFGADDGLSSRSIIKKDGVFISTENEKADTRFALDWHLLVLPSRMEAVAGVLRQNADPVLYEDDHAMIFVIAGDRYFGLKDRIDGMGGAYADFVQDDGLEEEDAIRGWPVKVMVYFSKQSE